MNSTLSYLETVHKRILPNCAGFPCSVVSKNVAERLLDDGLVAEIYIVQGTEQTDRPGRLNVIDPLRPLPYPKEEWRYHYVAVANGYVFDPILGRPVLLGEYSMLLFGKELLLEVSRDARMVKNEYERKRRSSGL